MNPSNAPYKKALLFLQSGQISVEFQKNFAVTRSPFPPTLNPNTHCLFRHLFLVTIMTLSTMLGLLVAVYAQLALASPIAEAHHHPWHRPPPVEHFTVTLTIIEPIHPTRTETSFPTFSGSGGFTGVSTGVVVPSSCIATFSVLSAVNTTIGTVTNPMLGAATHSQSAGKIQILGESARASVAGSESVGLGSMTRSGTFAGMWTLPAGCVPSGTMTLTDSDTGPVSRPLSLETGSGSGSTTVSVLASGSLSNHVTRTARTQTAGNTETAV